MRILQGRRRLYQAQQTNFYLLDLVLGPYSDDQYNADTEYKLIGFYQMLVIGGALIFTC